MRVPVGPRQLYLIDTSAQARSQHTVIRNVIAGLIADRAAAACVTVDLQAGYSGRNMTDVQEIREASQGALCVLPVGEAIANRARDVQLRMAARGHHRSAGVIDLLTAAVAEHDGGDSSLRRGLRAHRGDDRPAAQVDRAARNHIAPPVVSGWCGDKVLTHWGCGCRRRQLFVSCAGRFA